MKYFIIPAALLAFLPGLLGFMPMAEEAKFSVFPLATTTDEDSAPTWITLSSTSEIRGLVVRLGDVAEVKSLDATLARRIRAIEIGRFDEGRERIALTADSLKAILKNNGLSDADVVLRGAKSIVVTPLSTTVGPDRIRRMVERHVRRVLAGETIDAIRAARPLRPVSIPSAKFRTELRIEPDDKNELYAGRVDLALAVVVDGRVARRVPLPTIVERRGSVVVARKRIRAGRALRYEDLEIREVTLGAQGAGVFTRIEDAIGAMTRAPLVGGQPLRKDQLRQPPVIRRGDLITVSVQIGSLKASALCKAMKDAAPGERFSLQNLGSKKTVYAVAVDSRTANAIVQN